MKLNAMDRALALRKTLISDGRVLVVDFSDTLQGKDTSRVVDLMPNVNTGEYVFRAKVNVKEIDPLAAKEYQKDFVDITKISDKEIEDVIKRGEFDFPLWFKHNKGFNIRNALDYNMPFIVQIGGCNFHDGTATGGCWYCFVDDQSNDGKIARGKTWLGVNDIPDSMISAREKVRRQYAEIGTELNMHVLRISGGEPTTALDFILNVWREIGRRNLDFVGQIDSNLSTGSLVDRFEQEGIYERHSLEKLAEYPIKVLTAIKGVTEGNIRDNVQSDTTIDEQLHSIKRFLRAGFDIYPQMYNPDPAHLEEYLKSMDREIENFSLRIHLGPLKVYGPTKQRVSLEAKRLGLTTDELVQHKKTEWDNNYRNGTDVINAYLIKTYGVGYRDIVRSDVSLRVN